MRIKKNRHTFVSTKTENETILLTKKNNIMTTLTQRIEGLKKSQNSLIEKLRADRSDKTIMEQYRNLDAQIKELKKEENLQNLKNKIDNFNEANEEVKKIVPILMEYKDNILKVGGGHTKKYENFLKSIDSNFSIYAVKRYSFSDEVEIILQHKNRNDFKLYFENGNYKFYESENIDFETVLEARKQHNQLLDELEKLEDKIIENYHKASGRYILTDGDKKREFLNL